jgi:hypothetical protein
MILPLISSSFSSSPSKALMLLLLLLPFESVSSLVGELLLEDELLAILVASSS